MTADRDLTAALVEQVRAAGADRTPLRIVGGDTKRFYGREVVGARVLDVAAHAGVVRYDPAELVLTARGGTPLAEVAELLARHGQCLPFEPPEFGPGATLGGAVACGLAGPARVARGGVRDSVLGTLLLAGDGRVLRFGGEVMKNVAGYDVSRLLAGSLGILGVILEVSLKLMPAPVAQRTQRLSLDSATAVDRLATSTRHGLPLTGSHWSEGVLHARFAGSPGALDEAIAEFGGETLDERTARQWWDDVREQRLPHFLDRSRPLWRISLPATTRAQDERRVAFEWHGAQRWVSADSAAQAAGIAGARTPSHVTRFRPAEDAMACDDDAFAALPAPLMALHRAVKHVFDPAGILNPGRLYADL
jgi:glycolate oxidase FAD binding subunit